MIKLDQTKLHSKNQKGNCFATSLACILELPIESIPEFENMGEDWWPNFLKWLSKIGFTIIEWHEEIVLPGYYLVMGTSPRDPKINHQVIYKNGELAHDPHPSRAGLVNIKEIMALIPLDPAIFSKTLNCKSCCTTSARPKDVHKNEKALKDRAKMDAASGFEPENAFIRMKTEEK